MQNKLLPPLPRREIQYQRGRAKLGTVDLLDFYRVEFQVRHEGKTEQGLEKRVRYWARRGGKEKRGFNPLSGE